MVKSSHPQKETASLFVANTELVDLWFCYTSANDEAQQLSTDNSTLGGTDGHFSRLSIPFYQQYGGLL